MTIFWRPKGCVLWLDFAELSGDTVYDLSGHGNHGKVYGATWRRGPLIGSLYFDGVDDCIGTGFSGKLGTLSVEVMIRTGFDFGFVDALVVANRNLPAGRYGWNLYALQTKVIGFQTGDGELWYNAQASFADKVDTWVHVVGVHDGSKNYLYANGELVVSIDARPVAYTDQHVVTVAREPMDNSRFFHGIIALIRIYNRALSEDEIRAHYRYLMGRVQRVRRRFRRVGST